MKQRTCPRCGSGAYAARQGVCSSCSTHPVMRGRYKPPRARKVCKGAHRWGDVRPGYNGTERVETSTCTRCNEQRQVEVSA